jgi:eukaryotic-like serine/threonine-protein kinase
MSNSSPLESIFFAALEKHSSAERVALLDSACAGDNELRGRVERMLAAQSDAGSFLEHPAPPPDATCELPIREGRGSVIGPYKLLEQIGEGGMGVVFMAEQTRPVQRRVALKIIKAGMDTREVVARFEAERQALAMMDHPNIARVLDAGATDTGRPYFVMELVRGVPMTEFCNQKNLSIRERLELFVTVCQAVQHAHQKGIIHRDIKPTNVLVTLHDGRPMIKVIDFGVAKATGQKLTDKTLFTGFTQMIGTPLYMSPEQAEMTSQDIDTRSDIFSAGVLLYELLTGTTPFDKERLKNAAFDELRRIIREEEPPRPSTRLTTLALEAASTVGTQRQSDPRHLTRLFRGELDWIVMKCLEKDRTRRYETASALAGDVERYLHDEPVQACPPSARYRFGKFARRNKGALLTAAIVMLALVLGTVVSTWQAIRAYNAEAETKEFSSFLVSVFRSPDPSRDGRTITVAEVLDRSVTDLQDKFAENPLTKADLLEAIGDSYFSLSLFREAIPLFEQARDLRNVALGSEDLKTLSVASNLAFAYRQVGRINVGLPMAEEVVKLTKAKFGPEDPHTLMAIENLTDAFRTAGRTDDALRLDEENLKLCEAKLGHEDPATIQSMVCLALDYQSVGRLDEAIRLMEQVVNLRKSKPGPEHRDTLWATDNLAEMYRSNGRLKEALPLYEDTLKLRKAKLGSEHQETLGSMLHLALAYNDVGRWDERLLISEELLKLYKAKWGPDHHDTVVMMSNLATAYLDAGRIDEALRMNEEALKLIKAKLGPDHPETLTMMANLACDYERAGRTDAAIRLGEETLKLMKAKLGPEHLNTLTVLQNLACAYQDAGRIDEALRLNEETFKLRKAQLGPEHPETLSSMNNLAGAYLDANRLAEAEPLTREFLEIRERRFPDDWWNFMIRCELGEVLLRKKQYAEAEPLLISGYEGMQDRAAKIPPIDKYRLREPLQRLVRLYEATNQPEKAAAWKAKLTEFDKANPAAPKTDLPPTKKTESATEPNPPPPATNKSGT